jgi:hypothetical protein
VDKLSPEHVKAYMETYLENYKSAVGPLMGARGLRFLISDSWEAGAQNWTDRMIEEFTMIRPARGCPCSRRVVESARSPTVSSDFRRALSDMPNTTTTRSRHC